MAAGEIYQFTAVNILNAEPTANVFYLKVIDDTGSTDDLADAADALENQILFKIAAFQSDQLAYECILGRRVSPTTSPTRVITTSLVGAQISDPFPANVAINFRHYSENGNKNQRGRYFIAGLVKLFVTAGRLSQSQRPTYETFMDAVVAVITQSGRTYRMQHFSKKLNQFFDIDSMTVNPIPTKMRNRTPGLCSIS